MAVSNGLFTVTLDFGPGVFTGTNYWVEITVSPAGLGTFAKLVPRQQLTPAPYALSLVAPQATALCPPGSVMAYMGTNAPPGWLPCDGSAVPISQYPALFAVIGTASGNGNGFPTTFNLPDLRGVFLRGVNGTRIDGLGDPGDGRNSEFTGGNSGNAVGSYQGDVFKAHRHDNGAVTCGEYTQTGDISFMERLQWVYLGECSSPASGWGNENESTGYTDVQGGSETRPEKCVCELHHQVLKVWFPKAAYETHDLQNPFGAGVVGRRYDRTPRPTLLRGLVQGGGRGRHSTGGIYTVSGTFGQQDAGGPMNGGGYSVVGGFWSLFATQSSSLTGTAPTITAQPPSLIVSNGATVSFSVSVSGTGPLFYQWQENATNLTEGGDFPARPPHADLEHNRIR